MSYLTKSGIQEKNCAMCGEIIKSRESYLRIELETPPVSVLFFHILHFKEFLDIFSRFLGSKNRNNVKQFLKESIDEIREEVKIAKELGLNLEKDIRRIIAIKTYKEFKSILNQEFECYFFKKIKRLQDCFKCEYYKDYRICNQKHIYSIGVKIDAYQQILGEIEENRIPHSKI